MARQSSDYSRRAGSRQPDQSPARETRRPEKARTNAAQGRRGAKNVTAGAAALITAAALLVGGIGGFALGRRTGADPARLAAAEARVTELEGELTGSGGIGEFGEAGFGDDDFAAFGKDPFAGTGDDDAFGSADLEDFAALDDGTAEDWGSLDDGTGEWGDGAQDDGWNEDGLLGTLMESSEGDDGVVVAEWDGGQLLLSEVIGPYNERITTESLYFGDSTAATAEDVLSEVLQELVAERICRRKAEELGVTELTAEDEAVITAQAQEEFDSYIDDYRSIVDTTGMTREDARAAVAAVVEQETGVTQDGIAAEIRGSYWMIKLMNAVTPDVDVTDEEIQARYDELLARQTEEFEAYPEDYEFSMTDGSVVVYNRSGYRYVKQIMLTFDDPQVAEKVQDLYEELVNLQAAGADMSELTAVQEQLDALYTDLDAEAEPILEEVNAGADFDGLIEKYGEDPAMTTEPLRTTGYPVSASSSTLYAQEFIDASMTLEAVGNVSGVIHTISGAHIIKYVGNVTPGPVPLEDVRDAIAEALLTEKRENAFTDLEAQWIADAGVVYHRDRLQ